jgi:hypothetical protein
VLTRLRSIASRVGESHLKRQKPVGFCIPLEKVLDRLDSTLAGLRDILRLL